MAPDRGSGAVASGTEASTLSMLVSVAACRCEKLSFTGLSVSHFCHHTHSLPGAYDVNQRVSQGLRDSEGALNTARPMITCRRQFMLQDVDSRLPLCVDAQGWG